MQPFIQKISYFLVCVCIAIRTSSAFTTKNQQRLPSFRPTSSPSKCYIFFRTNPSLQGNRISNEILEEISTIDNFPYYCNVGQAHICIRRMQLDDLQRISDLCYEEYSTGDATLTNFPFDKPLEIGDWFDRLLLRPLVDSTMYIKTNDNPTDHAVLVATMDEVLVGMVEVSQQPVDPTNNPSPVPIPLAVKQALYGSQLQGWITNLLVAKEYRGRGLSKALVAAAERQAKLWRRTSIHLHCDASVVSGRIPQKLYESMGYEAISSDNFSWTQNNIACSVYVIDGIPLLYLRKNLVD